MAVLQPGKYLIELESKRPVDEKTLGRVLGAMGFSRAVPDQMPEGDSIGALPGLAAARTAVATTAPSSIRLTSAMMQPGTTAPAVAQPPPAPVAPKPIAATTTAVNRTTYAQPAPAVTATKRVANTTQQEAIWASQQLPGYKPPASSPVARPVVTKVNPLIKAPTPPKKKEPGLFDFGPGGGSPPPPPDPGNTAPPATETTPEDPGGTYADPGYGPTSDPASEAWAHNFSPGGGGGGGGGEGMTAPSGEYVASATAPSGDKNRLLASLWQAWRDFGTPFGGASTSGQEGPRRIRFIGELQAPIQTQDTSEIRWVSAVPLGIDPFEKLSLMVRPYQMKMGRTYELRFLSRSKSAPRRQDVEKLMKSMGWSVHRLSAIKSNMRLPGRTGANTVLWYGIADWQKPDSVVVADDPFYFEDMVEIT